MSTEWFVIDKRTGQIVNVITTQKPGPPDLSIFNNSDRLEATRTPAQTQLDGYPFYRQRP